MASSPSTRSLGAVSRRVRTTALAALLLAPVLSACAEEQDPTPYAEFVEATFATASDALAEESTRGDVEADGWDVEALNATYEDLAASSEAYRFAETTQGDFCFEAVDEPLSMIGVIVGEDGDEDGDEDGVDLHFDRSDCEDHEADFSDLLVAVSADESEQQASVDIARAGVDSGALDVVAALEDYFRSTDFDAEPEFTAERAVEEAARAVALDLEAEAAMATSEDFYPATEDFDTKDYRRALGESSITAYERLDATPTTPESFRLCVSHPDGPWVLYDSLDGGVTETGVDGECSLD